MDTEALVTDIALDIYRRLNGKWPYDPPRDPLEVIEDGLRKILRKARVQEKQI